MCGVAAVAVAAAANNSRLRSSGEHSIAAPVDRAYPTVCSTNVRRCLATASRPAGPGATAWTAPDTARPRCRPARCALNSKSRRFLSKGVPLPGAPELTGAFPSEPCNGASAARSCGAASGGTLASTPAAAAACAPPSFKHGTSSANKPDKDPRTPRATCVGADISGFGATPAGENA